jgi:hypothetical protein
VTERNNQDVSHVTIHAVSSSWRTSSMPALDPSIRSQRAYSDSFQSFNITIVACPVSVCSARHVEIPLLDLYLHDWRCYADSE